MNKFSERSTRKLKGVHPDLVSVASTALHKSKVDFGITEGVRSYERQRLLVDTGRSQTMKSRHLTGHAVDVVAYVNGYTYEPFELYVDIAEAFREAALEHRVEVLWGSAWLRALNTYGSAREAMEDYVNTRRSQGRKPFMDGPHFQLTWRSYPA